MRKFSLVVISFLFMLSAFAQDSVVNVTTTAVVSAGPKAPKFKPVNRAGDHLVIQLANNTWLNAPDSIKDHMNGFNRSANVYAMLDKPFKSNPQMSVAVGLGVSTSNIYFKEMEANIISQNKLLPFTETGGSGVPNFKKYKMTTAYVEVPLEFRFTANPNTPSKGLKFAVGGKVGSLISASTKGKLRQNVAAGTTINDYTQKIKSKNYFTGTRITGTARVGYGNFSLFGAYAFSPVFKDGVAADMKLLQFGLVMSGL